jgi:outer membrane protein assembly factor BamD
MSNGIILFQTITTLVKAEKLLAGLKQEQSKGLFNIGRFYEKKKDYRAALIYYNAVIEQDPKSDWANQAEKKVAMLTPRVGGSTNAP